MCSKPQVDMSQQYLVWNLGFKQALEYFYPIKHLMEINLEIGWLLSLIKPQDQRFGL